MVNALLLNACFIHMFLAYIIIHQEILNLVKIDCLHFSGIIQCYYLLLANYFLCLNS
uniref:Uncharacterized protein n=1 Tax=Rhizophora mucronata TaxID=61149 RepID=A0A2P2NBR0_RHIMU